MLQLVRLTTVLAILMTTSAHAEKLFDLVRKDGTVQEVTYQDFETIGMKTATTTLVGQQDGDHVIRGPLARDVLAHFAVEGREANIVALDNYEQTIPISDFSQYDVIFATEVDGKRLSVRERGPSWIMYPLKSHPELKNPIYEARSVWQVKEIRVK